MIRSLYILPLLCLLSSSAHSEPKLAANCVPYAASQCRCWTPTGHTKPVCYVKMPPNSTCGGCFIGCNGDGECIDEPYSDEDGFPLISQKYECSLIEYEDDEMVGECLGYSWSCRHDWCSDTEGMIWQMPLR